MTHRWNQTILIDENTIKNLIESQHKISVESIKLLDQGWDNLAYLINDEFIFRFPRRDAALDCIENEIALLPLIAKQVTFPLTSPEFIGTPSDVFPFPYAGYRMIQGKPLCEASELLIKDRAFAITLASWLKQLHSITPSEESIKAIHGDQSWRLNIAHRTQRCRENIAQYEKYFKAAGLNSEELQDIIHRISQFEFSNLSPVYVHGDLNHRHIIVEPTTLQPAGLIDFGDIHIGHPGIDLSVGMIFEESAFDDFLDAYGDVNAQTRAVLCFQAFGHGMSFLPYAYETNRASLKRWAYFQLRRAMEEIGKL